MLDAITTEIASVPAVALTVVATSAPPSGFTRVILQLFAWLAGIVLCIALVTSLLGMLVSMSGSGTASRVSNSVTGSSQQQSPGQFQQLQNGDAVIGESTPGQPTGLPGGDSSMPSESGASTGFGMGEMIDEGGPSSAPVPLTDKADHAREQLGSGLDDWTNGRASSLSESLKSTGQAAYDKLPTPVKKLGNLAKRGGAAYWSVFKQPDIASSIGEFGRISRESPIGHPDPPDEGTPVDPEEAAFGRYVGEDWEIEYTGDDETYTEWREKIQDSEGADVAPLHPDQYTTEGAEGDGDGLNIPDMIAGEESIASWEDIPKEIQQQVFLNQFPDTVNAPFDGYERGQLAGNLDEFLSRTKNPAITNQAMEGLTFEQTDGRASMNAQSVYKVGDVTSFEEFSHEMTHLVLSGTRYSIPETPDGKLHDTEISSKFHDLSDEYGQLPLEFSENSDYALPHETMFEAFGEPVGVDEWGDDVIEELEEKFAVPVDDKHLPGRDSPSDIKDDWLTDADTALKGFVSEVNRSYFKQQMLVEHAHLTGNEGDMLIADDVTIGNIGYSACNPHETAAQTAEVLQTADPDYAAKHVPRLEDYHPELVKEYRKHFEVSETAAQHLD